MGSTYTKNICPSPHATHASEAANRENLFVLVLFPCLTRKKYQNKKKKGETEKKKAYLGRYTRECRSVS
jgi:hypothetical protein